MRLRLSVQRNNLPVTHVLWNVPDTNSSQAYTIARLLEDVNKVLPLEAEQWGLEDYVVELGGFECLHFSPVAQSLKDDDHVSIRPLLTAEVRSRTLCGRHQISEDGRHLVDGIPFGRPYLRQPHRPSIRIPPRKRQRLEDEPQGEQSEMAGLITNGDPTPPPNNRELAPTHGAKNYDAWRRSWDRLSKFFEQDPEDSTDTSESDDSEEDDDFAPSETDESDSFREASVHSSGSSDASDGASQASSSGSSSGSSSDSESESDSNDDTGSLSSAPEVLSSKPQQPLVAPFHGSKNTRRRNIRRRESGKLRRLKADGLIHSDATLADLRANGNTRASADDHGAANPMSAYTGKRKRCEGEDEEDIPTESDKLERQIDEWDRETDELERRRQKLIASLERDVIQPSPVEAVTLNGEGLEPVPAEEPTAPTATTASKRPIEADSPRVRKRLLPDTSAIRRMLVHQTKNIEPKTLRKKADVERTPEPEGASEPDFWKSRINLSAFECWDEEFELSAPPFPFKQHWDPASKLMRDKANMKKAKKKAKKALADTEEATAYNEIPTETPILNYDESPDPSRSKRASDPTAAIENQLMQDVQAAAQSDLPLPPDDVTALPALEPKDIQLGAIIIFKEWIINPDTVTPEFSAYKTGVVEKEGDSGAGAGTFRLRLAARDVPKAKPAQPDSKTIKTAGDAFRMVDEEEEEHTDLWEGVFGQLVEPRLLMPAEG